MTKLTQETNDVVGLIERLRTTRCIDTDKDSRPILEPINPDGAEAADALQSQSARIAELEGALSGISKAFPIGPEDSISTWRNLANACRKHARDALTKDSTSG